MFTWEPTPKLNSCIIPWLAITHEIYKSFDEEFEVRGVFLDISKAFDKVWHEGFDKVWHEGFDKVWHEGFDKVWHEGFDKVWHEGFDKVWHEAFDKVWHEGLLLKLD